MLARFVDRLTYANVVATLALFVALGGTGYAAATITSADIKNRTIKGGDVRKNALGGNEINESKLRTVPRARRAQTAAGADIAKQAETANQATNSTNAAVADLARDAQTLAGQGANAFEGSGTVQFGKAPATPGGSSSEQTVLSWPEMGVELRSSSGGCGGGELRFAVRNTKSSGPDVVILDGPGGVVPANTTLQRCGSSDQYEGELTDSTGRSLFVDCFESSGEIRCLGVRSDS